jgi:hypothetical protein
LNVGVPGSGVTIHCTSFRFTFLIFHVSQNRK